MSRGRGTPSHSGRNRKALVGALPTIAKTALRLKRSGPNSEGSRNGIQSLFRLEAPIPTKTAFGHPTYRQTAVADSQASLPSGIHTTEEAVSPSETGGTPGPTSATTVASESEATPSGRGRAPDLTLAMSALFLNPCSTIEAHGLKL